MTWKAYAAVSGATVLAGWLASSPPENTPAITTSPAGSARAPQAAASADIQEEAERLQTRLRAERDYAAPQRNPFRFDDGGDLDRERGTTFEPQPELEMDAAPAAPAPPPMSLSGIAEDQVNGTISRTAVISSPGGVELLREGDQILGYRVVRIESEAVELVHVADGSSRRLALSR